MNNDSEVREFHWNGKAIGVNKWMKARSLPGKQRAMMYLTTEYRKYMSELTACAVAAKMEPIKGFCDVTVHLFLRFGADTDGPFKGLGDSLTKSGVIEDDKFIRNIHLMRHYHPFKIKDPVMDTFMVQLVPLTDYEVKIIEDEKKGIYDHL